MSSPLDNYDLPDIDEQLSDSESAYEGNAQEAKGYEKNPLKESGPPDDQPSRTESLHELEKQITKNKVPHHDVVNPTGDNALFPEEYQVETDTGLVRSTTALSLQKSRSRQLSNHSTDHDKSGGSPDENKDLGNGLTKEKLDKAVERNRRALAKQKNGKGFFHKLKGIFT